MSQTYDTIDKLTDAFTAQVMEHAESVRVFVTWRDSDDNTHSYTDAEGNFHAQRDQIKEWIEIQREDLIDRIKRKTP